MSTTRYRRAIFLPVAMLLAASSLAAAAPASAQEGALPGQPARLRVHTVEGSLSVTAVWEDVAGADDYHVQWRAFGPDELLNDGGRVEESQAEITVAGYGVWVLRVRACNAAGCGQPQSKRFTVARANRAPVIDTGAEHYSGFVETQNAPRGIWVSKPFDGIFTDPDGDTLIYTVSVPDDRAALVDQALIHPVLPRVFFRAEPDSNWGAVLPPLESPAITAVTLTATDPDGLSASVTGYMRTLWAPDSSTDLGLSLDGDHERITATWQAVSGAARYLVQWAPDGETYSSDRQQEEPGGQLSPAAVIEGLDNDTAYTVRVAALDGDGQELAAEELTAQPVSASDYIEDTFIDPYTEDFPWLAEAWYAVPVTVDVKETGASTYDHHTHTIHLNRADIDDRLVVTRKLAHHYLRSPQILEDSPERRLSILSLWLHVYDLRNRELIPPFDDGSAAINALTDYTLGGGDAEFADDQTLAIVAAASNGQIPQWYYDTYTGAGTVETTHLDALWRSLGEVDLRMGLFPHPDGARSLFGGFCSAGEADLLRHFTPSPWVDGGCVNQKVRELRVAPTSVAGELRVSWFEPAYLGHPATDHYVIQWKTGDQDYDEARQAIISKAQGRANYTITGLTVGTEYTIRVAPFNEADDSMFTNSDGHSRVREITATVPIPPLALSLTRLDGQITAAWVPYGVPVAKYVVRWRSGDQSFDDSRQREEPGGQELYSVSIDGLDNDTAYTVRVAALDDQDEEVTAGEQAVQRWSAFDHIETNFIDPHMEESPWLAEAWYGVPVKINVKESGHSTYHQNSHTIHLNRGDIDDRLVVNRQLAYHYLTHGDVHADDPEAMLSVLSMWLHEFDRIRTARSGENVCLSAKRALGDFTTLGDNADFPSASTARLAASVSAGEIPQWFYDTYTTDGTLATVDLGELWADIVYSRRDSCLYNLSGQTSGLFGGHCSLDEAMRALRNPSFSNPWADAGCLTRRPQALSATPGSDGGLLVSWQAPPGATTPVIDAYVVQWKSGDQEYDTTRQAIVTDLDNLTHIITGLAAGNAYTVRVAAVNQTDTAEFTDDDGYSRAAETAVRSELELAWWGDHERIFAEWQPVVGAASYLLQWRSGDLPFSSDRQREEPGGEKSYSFTIGGLDNDTAYTVRIAALDNQGQEIAAEEQAAQPVSGFDQIEDNLIVPYQDKFPWLHEAWFDVPAKITITDSGLGLYFRGVPEIQIGYPHIRGPLNKWVVWHELFHHYTVYGEIHADDPVAKLSILSLWLFEADRKARFPAITESLDESIAYRMNEYMRNADNPGFRFPQAHEETLAAYASVSRQEIPQWFYDTYTADGTVATTDLEQLWGDLRGTRRNFYFRWYSRKSMSVVFGGYCSWSEGTWALETAGARNPWVDGGCVNRRPHALTAAAGGAGELVVTWQTPLYSTTPEIDAYVVQWKSGDQDYDTTRQAAVTDLDNLTHTITGLTAGTDYTVRVAAVNQTDTADFTDDDGRERTAEATGLPS